MKNKTSFRKRLWLGTIAFFSIFLLWLYFSRYIMFKGEPLNSLSFWPDSVIDAILVSVIWYFGMGWWFKHKTRKKENVIKDISQMGD